MSALDAILPAARLCGCGCGKPIEGRPNKRYATIACRRRAEWRRYAPRASELRRKR